MTVTLGSKTLNLLGLSEISEVEAVKTDEWENGGYKRRYSVIGLLRKWQLECIEKNVAWNESAIKYLQEQAAQATKLDFFCDLYPGGLDELCVLHLPFYEGSGNIVHDVSGYGNNGTIYGASWVDTRDPKLGYALSFDGVDDYVNCGNDLSLFPSDAITFEVYVKVNDISRGYSGFLCRQSRSNGLQLIKLSGSGGVIWESPGIGSIIAYSSD